MRERGRAVERAKELRERVCCRERELGVIWGAVEREGAAKGGSNRERES